MIDEVIRGWRGDIKVELEGARAALTQAQAELQAADAAVSAAKVARNELTDAVSTLGTDTLSSSLSWRIRDREDQLRQVDGRLQRARNDVKTCHAKIADFERALQQLGQMSAVEEAV